MEDLERIKNFLLERNIRLSHQRLEIYKFLVESKNHPTVEMIYNRLKPDIPTLSKMTVYNSLNFFITEGIVKLITIEGYETRYDADLCFHGHLKCKKCGEIKDIDVGHLLDSDAVKNINPLDIDIFIRGYCDNCI